MDIPETFTYMHHDFTISTDDLSHVQFDDPDRYMMGKTEWRDSTITVDGNMTSDAFKSTLAHELYHVVLNRSGIIFADDELEKISDMLAYSLVEMFNSNEWFATFWRKDANS